MTLIAVFLDMEGNMYIDGGRTTRILNQLYQLSGMNDHYYVHPKGQIRVQFETPDGERTYQRWVAAPQQPVQQSAQHPGQHPVQCPTQHPTQQPVQHTEPSTPEYSSMPDTQTSQDNPSPSQASDELSQAPRDDYPNYGNWTRDYTLFILDLMKQFLAKGYDTLPKSLKEVEERSRLGRGNKKRQWEDFRKKLRDQFQLDFPAERIARRWDYLYRRYKDYKDNQKGMGNGTKTFDYLEQFEEMCGHRHDIVFPVTASTSDVMINHPNDVNLSIDVNAVPENNGAENENENETENETEDRRTCSRRKRPRLDNSIAEVIDRSDQRLTDTLTELTRTLTNAMEQHNASQERMMRTIVDAITAPARESHGSKRQRRQRHSSDSD